MTIKFTKYNNEPKYIDITDTNWFRRHTILEHKIKHRYLKTWFVCLLSQVFFSEEFFYWRVRTSAAKFPITPFFLLKQTGENSKFLPVSLVSNNVLANKINREVLIMLWILGSTKHQMDPERNKHHCSLF